MKIYFTLSILSTIKVVGAGWGNILTLIFSHYFIVLSVDDLIDKIVKT